MTSKKLLMAAVGGVLFGAVFGVGWVSMAENTELDTGPRAFPYHGVLDLDGAAYTGEVDLRVTLVDDGDSSWSEEHSVAVRNGRFATDIGVPSQGVPDWVFDADAVYITLSVRASDEEEYVTLAGQQPLRPVPFALWVAEGHGTEVAGELYASGSFEVSGSAQLSRLTLTGNATDLSVSGATTATSGDSDGFEVGSTNRWLRHQDEGGSVLELGAGGDAPSVQVAHADQVGVEVRDGVVQFTRPLTIARGANIDVQGTLTIPPRFTSEARALLGDADEVVDLGSTTDRFCAIVGIWDDETYDITCEVRESGGRYEAVNGRHACAVRCVTW
jgi:hypothetical protein